MKNIWKYFMEYCQSHIILLWIWIILWITFVTIYIYIYLYWPHLLRVTSTMSIGICIDINYGIIVGLAIQLISMQNYFEMIVWLWAHYFPTHSIKPVRLMWSTAYVYLMDLDTQLCLKVFWFQHWTFFFLDCVISSWLMCHSITSPIVNHNIVILIKSMSIVAIDQNT